MPVVDVHSHLMAESWLPEAWHRGKVDQLVHEAERRGDSPDRSRIRADYVESLTDPTGERLLARMDDADIDHQVVFAVDWGLPFEGPATGIRAYNRRIREFAESNPGRVTGFVSIDPRRNGAVAFVDRALDGWAGGLKLHPTTGFYPHGEAASALLEVAADHGVPVMIHQGPINAPLRSEYAHPCYLDTVVSRFPDLDVIAAHMAIQWWEDLLHVAEVNANTGLRVDISYWQLRFLDDPDGSARVLRRFLDSLGPDRVHFGTDYPVFWTTRPAPEWVDAVRSLADRVEAPTFTDAEIAGVLGDGAATLLGLE